MTNSTQNPIQARRTIALLVRIFGTIFLIATIATVIQVVRVSDLLANSTRVDGHVVELKPGSKGTQAPVVRFSTASGETLQLQSSLYTSPAPIVGETVKVIYRTSNPQDWQIDDWINLYFGTILSSIFMVAWGVATIVMKVIGDKLPHTPGRVEKI